MNKAKGNLLADVVSPEIDHIHLKPDTSKMILAIDADTIVYATCSVCEFETESGEFDINLEEALILAESTISEILLQTGCATVELYFTSGRNFRYTLLPEYKANRLSTRYPVGLKELKVELLTKYRGEICSDYEADDVVCMLKREYPDRYILAAIDKDVLNGVAGVHFNYFKRLPSTNKYGTELKRINRQWKETHSNVAIHWPYLQCLMGDEADGIKGLPGCGPAKALDLLYPQLSTKLKELKKAYKDKHGKNSDKLIEQIVLPEKLLEAIDPDEAKLWDTVVTAFTNAGLSEKTALTTMRLIHMHQLTKVKGLELWTPRQ